MKIKKYVAGTSHEAMLNLKKELGPDAVVLNTKTIRAKGILGYFKKPLIEVTAAYEEKDLFQRKTDKNYDYKLNNINDELKELKMMIKSSPLTKWEESGVPLVLEQYHNRLISNGIEPKISSKLLNEISRHVNLDEKDNETIENIIKYSLMESLGNPQPITIDGKQKIIFFIGSTGVGKTTTLAKIAAKLVLEDKYDIGLITSDTYRIAAVDQLRIYSDILGLPLEIAYNKADMTRAYDVFKDKDIILVDTAGRNHNDTEQVEELKSILNSVDTKEVYLLLNATIDFKVLGQLLERYEFLDDFKIIITKIDEAGSFGNILNIRSITNKELSYYTIGQNVPDDFKVLDTKEISEMLIKESNKHGSS